MYLLNLSMGQFLVLLGSVSAVVTMLYLLDRSRRSKTVSTLRFWIAAEQPVLTTRRKRLQQPWSLLLQLISMALLLLAIAQLRWGAQAGRPRDHVLILDTSAWMDARTSSTLMDDARARALAYLKSVPSGDRVMLVRADALATPATAFEHNRPAVERAIRESRPGATALNLNQAFHFAQRVQALGSRRAGEIVFAGAGRVTAEAGSVPGNLRVLQVRDDIENCGIRKIGVRRSASEANVWDILLVVRNYGARARTATISLSFGGAAAGARLIVLAAGAEREVAFRRRTRAAGVLEATLTPHDGFPADDRASLELPAQKDLAVTVYSDEPELLRPILSASPRVRPVFRPTAEYSDNNGGLVVLDRFRPAKRPKSDSIWIAPPVAGSPIPVRMTLENIPFTRWCSSDPLCEGLRTRELRLPSTRVFESAPGDLNVAEVLGGPVIVARPGRPKIVAMGFHPALSDVRYALATPLLFANILRWISPDVFRHPVLSASSAGAVTVELDSSASAAGTRVLREDGTPLPFTMKDRSLRFFTGSPGTVRVLTGDREFVYSLTLPELWESRWQVPAGVKRGLPPAMRVDGGSRELWPWMAVLGGLGLLTEWLLFGRFSLVTGKIRRMPPRFRKTA